MFGHAVSLPCRFRTHFVLLHYLYVNWKFNLAWAELYMTVAALVQRFDFTFVGAGPKDVVCVSDQFITGTKDSSGLKVYVSSVEG
jgi:hypothetical protein